MHHRLLNLALLSLPLLLAACGRDDYGYEDSGGCCGGSLGNLFIVILVLVTGYVISNKIESNGDLLRSIYSDVKRLSRKVEELEERLGGTPDKDEDKKS